MPRTKSKANRGNQNEDSKSEVSHGSRSQNTRNQKGRNSARKGKARQTAAERSASKTRNIKEEVPSSQPVDRKASVGGIEIAQVADSVRIPGSQIPTDKAALLRRQMSAQSASQASARQADPRDSRYPPQASAGGQPKPPQGAGYARMPHNLPPQITAADVARAQSNIPSESELVEAEIAGEKVKASYKTIDYLKRFETFLNKTPTEKLKLLNERFFRKIPRDTGVFKTNRGKDTKCPVCMRDIGNTHDLEEHFNKKHQDLVAQGIEYSNGQWTASNKVANVVAMFCFTHSSATSHIAKVARDRLKGKEYFKENLESEE